MEFVRQTFGSNSATAGHDASEVPPQKPAAAPPHVVPFGFSDAGWQHLNEVGLAIGTTTPSQIIRRALATLWLVASGQCSLKDNLTGKTRPIPD